ncbi:Uncharacterized protein ycf72, partial [Auxenochlorella protothecoides]
MRPLTLPRPPPCGWSTEFIAMPRTRGFRPRHRVAPALPCFTFLCCALPRAPIVAVQARLTSRCSPEGSL